MRSLTAALLMLCAGPAMAQTIAAPQVLDTAVNAVIRPAMISFKARASDLEAAMDELCTSPSATALTTATERFGAAATAYGQVEFLRIGPLMEDNRSDRLLFWPDRKGIALRQVQAILADDDVAATDLTTLRGKSVAVQGFGALEFVLYGTDSETLVTADGAFRCSFGQAIAANINQIAGELEAGWLKDDGIASHLIDPQPSYADYRTDIEALEALVGLVSHGIEATRDSRINPFVAKGTTAAKPKQALFWRSDLTLPMIRANIEGMRLLIEQSGVARDVTEKDKSLDGSIAFEFSNALRAIDLVTLPVEQAVTDEKQAHALSYLVLVTSSLQSLVGDQLSAALGLSVGFSSLDGD
ncbi:hypothetical protein WH87_14065 [Devosia epidermidihirudinis]|uniref:Imelysin-like domain-containing protein n=1 Tax=Devosia epidermidihirudinis TaxID=1293439 RepID=A0A0F5Q6N3_9HYPH|nr:imelysin family protein [Devosia epidermidihirudinis]KKC36575.1 hypothetical protein WH87_14065 [Devosia epidermidihirudinis]